MTEHPTSFFTKEILRSSGGRKCLVVSVVLAILSGSILPHGIAKFVGYIGTSQMPQAAGFLLALLVAIGLVKRYQEQTALVVVAHLKSDGRVALADKIERSPFALSEDDVKTTTARFLSAQQTAFFTMITELVKLIAGLGSFTVVLVIYAMPWWVYALEGVVVILAASAYRSLKNSTQFKQAGNLESEVGDHLAELCESRNNRQVHPAIKRALKATNRKAFNARIKSNRHTLRHYLDVRNLIGTVICGAAILAACQVVDTTAATLLVVFMFTFSGYITAIHGIASSLETVETDGQPMIDIVSQSAKPLLHSHSNEACVHTSDVVAHYLSKDRATEKQVALPDLSLEQGGLYVFTGENGIGKSSLFKAIAGEVKYAGDLLLWGQQAQDFDSSMAVSSFQQVRRSLTVKSGDAFKDERGEVDQEAMDYALWCVNAENIDLEHIHAKLSGGQRQKIDLALQIYRSNIAREYIRLIVIDEPTNNFDRESVALTRKRLVMFITECLKQGITVMIATHDEKLQDSLLELSKSREI